VQKKMIAKTNHLGALAAAVGALVAVGLLVLMLVDVRPAQATFPGKPAKIAYEGDDGNDSEIYSIRPGGGGRVKVTDNAANDYGPSYSPNGKRIAYYGYDGQDYEIYTINAGGGGKKQLTDNSTNEYTPSYSPSGKKIAYSGQDGPISDREIYTINAGGGGKFKVTDNGTDDYQPSWGSS
jgi:Tol biopolymer transport system component